jgi:hypothetical protein
VQVPLAIDLIVAASLITQTVGVFDLAEAVETRDVGIFKVVEDVPGFSELNFDNNEYMLAASPLT